MGQRHDNIWALAAILCYQRNFIHSMFDIEEWIAVKRKGFDVKQLRQFSNILVVSCMILNKALNYPKTQALYHRHTMSTS